MLLRSSPTFKPSRYILTTGIGRSSIGRVVSTSPVARAFVRFHFLYLIALLIGLVSGSAEARTWIVSQTDVSADAQTIQGAINRAQSGDSVIVDPGTYFESIEYFGKNIVVASRVGALSTIIDCSGISGSCVRIRSGESQSAVLDGFTVTGGTGEVEDLLGSAGGGGIFIQNAQPTITNNIITSNSALCRCGGNSSAGGGILCKSVDFGNWQPVIRSNKISFNVTGLLGGGIAASGTVNPLIEDNDFEDNRVTDGDGGGIALLVNNGGTEIRRNRFVRNVAGDHGGGVYAGAAGNPVTVSIEMNLFWANNAQGLGPDSPSGGALALGGVIGAVYQNTIVFNSSSGYEAGGIAISSINSPCTIQRNIISGNTQGGLVCSNLGGPASTISENIFWQNTPWDQTYCSLGENLFLDPYFCDPANGDFRVAENSPALTSSFAPIGAYDISGCGPVTPVIPVTWSYIKALRAK